jgi:putative methanogenesis marker 16 metalloprotein
LNGDTMNKTIDEINQRIAKGEAVVLTAKEVEELLVGGREDEVKEVDVVTTGTMGLMSGTYALLSFQIAEPGIHRRFRNATINGVPVSVGPCPNESLGIIDVMIFGTAECEDRPDYGGSFLFRDLVEGREVVVRAISNKGLLVETVLTINEMPTAKLLSSRNCFRNYRAFVNPSDKEFSSIFHCRPFPPNYAGMTFSGCGHYNPIQNDPGLECTGVGTRLLFNGNEGFVVGSGTRSSPKYPNLMTVAEMRGMDPTLMGGFLTAAGPECLTSYAIPIPIINDSILKSVLTRDADIPLSIGDIRDRHKIGQADYGQVWTNRDEMITLEKGLCINCPRCAAMDVCPTFAIKRKDGLPFITRDRCVNCGVCVKACPEVCFIGSLGEVDALIDGENRAMPIMCRNSNRVGAIRTMEDLKERILDRQFLMTSRVANIAP